MLPAFQGLVNQMRPWASTARSLGVLRGWPSQRSAMATGLPSGSKRTMARPPEQQPNSRPWASWARPLVRLVPSRQVVIWSVRGSMRRMRLAGMWVNSNCSPSQIGPSATPPRGLVNSSNRQFISGTPGKVIRLGLGDGVIVA